MRRLSLYLADECGASAAEYGLILALIAAGIIAALGTMANAINGVDNNVASSLNSAVSAS